MAKFEPDDVQHLIDLAVYFQRVLSRVGSNEPANDEAMPLSWNEVGRRTRRLLERIETPDDFAAVTALLSDCPPKIQAGVGHQIGGHSGSFALDAVHHHAPEDLRLGLIAAALGYTLPADWREFMEGLPLLYRAAELLGRDPVAEFDHAADIVGDTLGFNRPPGTWLRNYARADPEDRALAGFHLIEEGEGADWRIRRLDELVQELIDVIPVAQNQTHDGATITVFSIERYTDGFIVNYNFVPGRAEIGGRVRYRWNVSDEQGHTYTRSGIPSGSSFSWTHGVYRVSVLFTPALQPGIQSLRLELASVERQDNVNGRWIFRDYRVGPWAFTVPIPPTGKSG